jgi:uncharacterized protein
MNDDNFLFDPITQDPPQTDMQHPPSMSPVFFYSNGSKVLGTFFVADGKGPHPTVIMLIGFPGNELNHDIAHTLRRQGYNILQFFYRGSWGSEGNYLWSNIPEDTGAAINFLRNDAVAEKFRIDKDKISLIGYSMGGFGALYMSLKYPEIKNVVFIAGSNLGAFGEIVAGNKSIYDYAHSTMQPLMSFVKCESPKILLDEMIENKKEWNLLNHLEKLSSKNLLLIGAKYDSTVPLDFNHIALVNSLKARNANIKDYILETGHSFSNKRIELMRIISDWYKQSGF